MNLKILFNINTSLYIRIQNIVSKRSFASNTADKDIDLTTKKSIYEVADEVPIFETDNIQEEAEIRRIRNKSRLSEEHRNILFGNPPYQEAIEWYHNTVKYKKRMLGRYGFKGINVPAGFAWPTPEEVEDMKEYERTAYPYSIQEEWARAEERNKKKAEEIKAREAKISENIEKMDKWIKDLHKRRAQKEQEVIKAKQLKQRLIDQVRNELGPHLSVRDEKFIEALEKKEKAIKKQQKEAKKKLKQEASAMKTKSSTPIDSNITTPPVDETKTN